MGGLNIPRRDEVYSDLKVTTVELRHGEKVELTRTEFGHLPGLTPIVKYGKPKLWIRKPGGPWKHVPTLSTWRASTLAKEQGTADEAIEWVLLHAVEIVDEPEAKEVVSEPEPRKVDREGEGIPDVRSRASRATDQLRVRKRKPAQ